MTKASCWRTATSALAELEAEAIEAALDAEAHGARIAAVRAPAPPRVATPVEMDTKVRMGLS